MYSKLIRLFSCQGRSRHWLILKQGGALFLVPAYIAS